MSTLDNILSLLNKWPAWKRITSAPDELDAMRKRVEALEAAAGRAAVRPDQCPKCSSLSFRLTGNRKDQDFGDMGISYDRWACANCGYSREVEVS